MPTAERRAVIRAHDAARAPYLELACLRIIDFLLIGYLRLLKPPPPQFSSSHGTTPIRPYPSARRDLLPVIIQRPRRARTNGRPALRGLGMQPSARVRARPAPGTYPRQRDHRVPPCNGARPVVTRGGVIRAEGAEGEEIGRRLRRST